MRGLSSRSRGCCFRTGIPGPPQLTRLYVATTAGCGRARNHAGLWGEGGGHGEPARSRGSRRTPRVCGMERRRACRRPGAPAWCPLRACRVPTRATGGHCTSVLPRASQSANVCEASLMLEMRRRTAMFLQPTGGCEIVTGGYDPVCTGGWARWGFWRDELGNGFLHSASCRRGGRFAQSTQPVWVPGRG